MHRGVQETIALEILERAHRARKFFIYNLLMRKVRGSGMVLAVLLCVVAVMWYAVLREDRHGILTVSFLDVGQGDSVYIDAPSGQVLMMEELDCPAALAQMPW